MITKSDAVASLRPNTQWVMYDNDVAKITWHTSNTQPLTTVEVEAEMVRLEAEVQVKVEAEQAARAAAITHAKSLGFTDEMIAVMYPNLGSEA